MKPNWISYKAKEKLLESTFVGDKKTVIMMSQLLVLIRVAHFRTIVIKPGPEVNLVYELGHWFN